MNSVLPWLLVGAVIILTPIDVRGTAPDSVRYSRSQLRVLGIHSAPPGRTGAPVSGHDRPRSVPLALGLSAAVPGTGQLYNRHWIKGALALGLEAALVGGYVLMRRKGLRGEDQYIAYAHAHWSPVQYARWLEDYSEWQPDTPRASLDIPGGIDFTRPDVWSAADRARVRAFFEAIRAVEQTMRHPNGASFSHKLPFFAEQQYYELIGKYPQFAPGWEDYPVWRTDRGFTDAIDPDLDGEDANIRGRFVEYARDHERANDQLRTASRLTSWIVVTHLLSAVDAAISAKLHNNRLVPGLTYAAVGEAEPRTLATLRLRL